MLILKRIRYLENMSKLGKWVLVIFKWSQILAQDELGAVPHMAGNPLE